ncbi:MAG: hypothetical protein ABIK11_02605 [candidate division WOR-3 bacterium]
MSRSCRWSVLGVLLITLTPARSQLNLRQNITDRPLLQLEIAPDQNDQLQIGEKKNYRFFVNLSGDSGSIVEFLPPFLPAGWNGQLYDSANTLLLTDDDRDGFPELGFVQPGRPHYFTLRIEAPTDLSGDTGKLDSAAVVITAFLDNDSLVRDSVRLNIRLIPGLLIHNFPNPLEDQTTFVIGIPDNGEVSLFIFNRAGKRICTILQHEPLATGVHLVGWNARNDRNRPVASGTYDYLLEWKQGERVHRIKKKLVVNRR